MRKSMNLSLKRILRKIPGLVRLEGIGVENKNALDFMREEMADPKLASETMYFLDSPYLENRAGYIYNMVTEDIHREYCELVGQLGGYRMVCGYDYTNSVYDEVLVRKYGFHKYIMGNVAKSMQMSAKGKAKSRAVEVIWTSYALQGPYAL